MCNWIIKQANMCNWIIKQTKYVQLRQFFKFLSMQFELKIFQSFLLTSTVKKKKKRKTISAYCIACNVTEFYWEILKKKTISITHFCIFDDLIAHILSSLT